MNDREKSGEMTTKTFDSAKLMRELRDKLSQEMEGMTTEERVRYIRDKVCRVKSTETCGEIADTLW